MINLVSSQKSLTPNIFTGSVCIVCNKAFEYSSCYFYKGHWNCNCNFVLFLWTEKEKNESKNQITRNLINLQKFDLKGIMIWPTDILLRNFCRRLSDNPDNPVCHKPIYCLEKKEMVFCYQNCSDLSTVGNNYSSDLEKLLKFEAEGQEFAKFLRSLE